jgi:DNA-binding SARP family transcriptional activator/ATP/maltotriose-dependent transcriptional regulator MalT
MAATEGWPLGLALALSAPHGFANSDRPASGTGDLRSPDALHRFLEEEVLDPLPAERRRAVIDSSVPRNLTPRVIEALGLSGDFLAEAERSGLLLRREPQPGETFAYHPLLREFLRERFHDEHDDDHRRELHARLAPAVAESGYPIDALEHWLEAGDWPQAVATLASEGPAHVLTSPELVRSWLDRLPDEVRSEPEICLLEGQLHWGGGDHARASGLLREAMNGCRRKGNVVGEWASRCILCDALFFAGRMDEGAELGEGFDDAAAGGAGVLAPAAAISASACLAALGRIDASNRLAERARLHPAAGPAIPMDAIGVAFRDIPRGRLNEALSALNAAAAELERADPFNRRLSMMALTAVVLDEQGRFGDALAVLDELGRWVGHGQAPVFADSGHAYRAHLHAQAGRVREAEAELARSARLERGWRAYQYDVAAALVHALRGEVPQAVDAVERALATASSAPILFRFWAAFDPMPALVRVGQRRRAGEVLAQTLTAVDEALPGEGGCFLRARLLARRAWLGALADEREQSDADLTAFWTEAGSSVPYIVRREWSWLEPLMRSALKRGILDAAEAMKAIVAAFPAGLALVAFLDHPVAEVRRAALEPAIASGHPATIDSLSELADDPDPGVATRARHALTTLQSTLPPLSIQLLGGFSIRRGAWRIEDSAWARPIDARLVRFLIVNRGIDIPEELIFEALWPGAQVETARRSLQVVASRARRLLDPPGTEHSVLERVEGGYRMRLGEGDMVDAEEFEAAAVVALAERGAARRALLERAQALWGGEPLPGDRYAEWTLAWRQRLIDRYLEVLNALVGSHGEVGDHLRAIDVARELVVIDPLDEGAHRKLMAAYARAGRTGHALRQYLECRRALVEGLGIEPAEATSRLQAGILAGESV